MWVFKGHNGAIICCAVITVDARKILLIKRQTAYYIPFLEEKKKKYLFKRENDWFKLSVETKVNKKICFALNVEPDCRPHTLQLLLCQMDKKLFGSISSPQGAERTLSPQSTAAHEQVENIARQAAFDRMVFSKDKADDQKKGARGSSFKKGGTGKSTASDEKVGRPVYYVMVGQTKCTRIRLRKPNHEISAKVPARLLSPS